MYNVKNTNVCGPVSGITTYEDGVLTGRDVNIDLPEIAPATADIKLMGTYTMPVWSQIEHMVATITKIGMDKGLGKSLGPGQKTIECRWAQTCIGTDGKSRTVGCKAFLTGECSKIPGISLEVGSPIELPVEFGLRRYALYVDGVEIHLIDRIAGICRINGKDYADLNAYL